MNIVTDVAKLRGAATLVYFFPVVAQQLVETMVARHGQGLAANQVGLPFRMFVMKREGGIPPSCIVNPFIYATKGAVSADEGCLSLPGVIVKVQRPKMVKITGYNQYGVPMKWTFHGIEARRACHEIDHLNGRLITDYE